MPITAAELVARVSVEGVDTASAKLGLMGGIIGATEGTFKQLGAGMSLMNFGLSNLGTTGVKSGKAIFDGMAQAGGALWKIAGIAALVGAALVVGIGVKSVEMAGNFQQATNTLVTSAGLSKNSIDAIRQGILKMSVDTATSWEQLNAGMFNVESALHLGTGDLLVLKAAAEGAKAENSDLAQTTDVLTTAMVNYHLPASQAVDVMNSLITTVAAGKLHMNDLTGSLRNVLPVAAAFHIDLAQVEGALATMANAGDRGTSAGTHLAMMFKMLSSPVGAAKKEMAAMGLDSIKLAETMRTSIPGALKMIQDAVAQHFTPGSVEYNRAILAILGGSKSGVAGLEIMNQGLKVLGKNTSDAAAALHKGSKDVENWGTIQHNFNFQVEAAKNAVAAMAINIGTALLPVLTKFLTYIVPIIVSFGQWLVSSGLLMGVFHFLIGVVTTLVTAIGNFASFLQHNAVAMDIFKGALIALGIIIATLMVAALVAWTIATWNAVVAMIALTWPALLVIAAIVALVAAFLYFYRTNAGFRAFIDGMVAGFKNLALIIGHVLGSITNDEEKLRIAHEQKMVAMKITADNQTAQMAQRTIQNYEVQRVGILKKLKDTHDPAERLELQHQLNFNTMQINGQKLRLANAEADKQAQLKKQAELHAQMLEAQKWFGQRFLDMTVVWTGNVFSAIGTWTHHILDLIGAWIGDQMSKLGGMVHGWFTWMGNLKDGVLSAIGTTIHLFLTALGNLKDAAISKAIELVTNFVSMIASLPGRLAGLAGSLIAAGAQIVGNIASGIVGAIGGALGNAMGAVGNFISSHLPHSPAKVGPLKDLEYQGNQIMSQIAKGMRGGLPELRTTLQVGLSPLMAPGLSAAYASRSSLGTTTIVVQPPDLILDGVRLSRQMMPHITNAIRYNVSSGFGR